jgi:hypothetical protein
MAAVLIRHRGRRIGMHGSFSTALSRLRTYPIGAEVIQIEGGTRLAERVHCCSLPPVEFMPAKWR